eukprot:4451636-Prymnesium_polylepis.1
MAILQTPQLKASFGASDKFEAGKFKLLLRLAPTKPGEHEKARIEQFIPQVVTTSPPRATPSRGM